MTSSKKIITSVERKVKQLTAASFAEVLQDALSVRLRRKINELQLCYTKLTPNERDQCILSIVRTLQDSSIVRAGSHRLSEWEAGWAENVKAIKAARNLKTMIPRYFGKYKLARWRQEFIHTKTDGFDYKVLDILVEWMLEKWMASMDSIYEFGCGPGFHLVRAHNLYPHANLTGLDWAKSSQAALKQISKKGLVGNLAGRNFDFFNPDYSLKLPPNSGIYTVAALEQVGADFEPFIQFLLKTKPSVCAHIEPIEELLDPHHLVDGLSLLYFRKRNYLTGFLSRLRKLEMQKKVRIIKQQRTYTGSLFIEGHSLVVWKPL